MVDDRYQIYIVDGWWSRQTVVFSVVRVWNHLCDSNEMEKGAKTDAQNVTSKSVRRHAGGGKKALTRS
jgi:hypothetical protein